MQAFKRMSDTFKFGKYEGETLTKVVDEDPDYVRDHVEENIIIIPNRAITLLAEYAEIKSEDD